ncbi:MAG: hypothetical protein U0T81_10375 [Saprospiraceae bacterium]
MLPSGVPAMGYGIDGCIIADLVVGFGSYKLAYFLPENEKFISSWTLVSVGFPQKEGIIIFKPAILLQNLTTLLNFAPSKKIFE